MVKQSKVIGSTTESESQLDSAVAQGGAYEIIRKRLVQQGQSLSEKTNQLNSNRLEEFGSSDMEVSARIRVRTENNCVARDIVQAGGLQVFGYNVFIGLRKETAVADVFSLFQIKDSDSGSELEPVSLKGSFLDQASFVSDFRELYAYYKNAKLIQLSINKGHLLAAFQIGERIEDTRVFRWSVSADGSEVQYLDNRGERDIELPPAFDFEWVEVTREHAVNGRHPHFNILDKVFVETVNGDLTIKIEDNTNDGQGIYREPVVDQTQSLDDADVYFADRGELILLKIKPYREEVWRYLVFNNTTKEVLRIDALGQSCQLLPEDQGIIFPGGCYLQTGECKQFEDDASDLKFKRSIRSPNGEDILYIFYAPEEGRVALFPYNLITKELSNPIYGHGYSLSPNGQVVIFSANNEPTRIHPMQIWNTQFQSIEFASKAPVSQSFYGRIGNAELVRGISELYGIYRIIDHQKVSSTLYLELSRAAKKMFDNFYWISDPEIQGIDSVLKEISNTATLVLDEFEKVESIRHQASTAMQEAETAQGDILQAIHPENWETPEEFVDALDSIRKQRGHLMTIKDYRYIDTDKIQVLDLALVESQERLGIQTVEFLAKDEALHAYFGNIEQLNAHIENATTVALLLPQVEAVDKMASGLDLLSELMSSLKVEDATVRTRIVDSITDVYSKLNQSKAAAKHKQKSLGSGEAKAQFASQFKLFSQSVANALGMSHTPERCDEQLSRLLVQLEEIEGQFSDFDEFLSDIVEKREEVYESFESHKQQLLDERQRKAQSVLDAASRMLQSIERRSMKFTEADELNTYFASDALVLKIYEQTEKLRDLEDPVKADDIESRFKAIKEQAARALRDKSDIFEDGGSVIKLGPRHKFSVNTQELDLTIIPRENKLNTHLIGTDFYEAIQNDQLMALRKYWDISLESESEEVYRSEYLAYLVLEAAQNGEQELSLDKINLKLSDDEALLKLVRSFSNARYKEGYEKGIHDVDAVSILQKLLPVVQSAGLLRFDPLSRGLAAVYWANHQTEQRHNNWPSRALSAAHMKNVLGSNRAFKLLIEEVSGRIQAFLSEEVIQISKQTVLLAAEYLVEELSAERPEFVSSRYARQLVAELKRSLDDSSWRKYQNSLDKLKGCIADRWHLSEAWLHALVEGKGLADLERYIPEAIALLNADERIDRHEAEVDLEIKLEGLIGEHIKIQDRSLTFGLDEFLSRLNHHKNVVIPDYHAYLKLRQNIIEKERDKLRLEEYKPRPLSSFVRNKLINDAYLPIIGDNLAKQMGTVGDKKRTDLMGLLMMISPPGYGKTTLMEYVASRLGLIFMKVNCPSLGHDVLSLDPEQAPNATSKQELIKLNLGLEMGNNVMLYLDDIQHTNPEFLQKFISLCDGTRRIEGVWNGKTQTYDMRGKKFCVVMAGNPYTESGDMFKIPDMLANRADIYNLGDILGGMDEQFELSYIENSLTSNAVLAPLATREMEDVYRLVDMAKGKQVATTDLSHSYSGAEINEITEVLKKMFAVQEVVLKVNKQYIASAAQAEKYRVEPSFKLQGSYRNMNKMAEKISAVMNKEEMMVMIRDHYLGEAQLLTSGAEENLLKLAELRGNITEEENTRWQKIKHDFKRSKEMGGDDADGVTKVANQIANIADNVVVLQESLNETLQKALPVESPLLEPLQAISGKLASVQQGLQETGIKVALGDETFTPIERISDLLDDSVSRLTKAVEKSVDFDITILRRITKLSAELRSVSENTSSSKRKKALKDFEELDNDKPKASLAAQKGRTRKGPAKKAGSSTTRKSKTKPTNKD